MADIVVYRAKNTKTISEYAGSRLAAIEKWKLDRDTYSEKLGGRKLHGISLYTGGWIIQGYVKNSYSEELPPGWRLAKSRGSWEIVPAKRSPEGKEHVAELQKLNLAEAKYPGFPQILSAKNHSVFPRLRRYDNEYFVVLSMEVDDSGVDQAQWERITLAEFYTATENKEYEEYK